MWVVQGPHFDKHCCSWACKTFGLNFPSSQYKNKCEVTGGQYSKIAVCSLSHQVWSWPMSHQLVCCPQSDRGLLPEEREMDAGEAYTMDGVYRKYLGKTASLPNFAKHWGSSQPDSWWPTQPHLSQLTHLISNSRHADLLTVSLRLPSSLSPWAVGCWSMFINWLFRDKKP